MQLAPPCVTSRLFFFHILASAILSPTSLFPNPNGRKEWMNKNRFCYYYYFLLLTLKTGAAWGRNRSHIKLLKESFIQSHSPNGSFTNINWGHHDPSGLALWLLPQGFSAGPFRTQLTILPQWHFKISIAETVFTTVRMKWIISA